MISNRKKIKSLKVNPKVLAFMNGIDGIAVDRIKHKEEGLRWRN